MRATGGERLGDIVVCAELQADHLVDLAILRRHHDDRHRGLLAERAADLRARDTGQHEIEQDEIGAVPIELIERGGTVCCDTHLVSLAPKHEGQRIREGLLVLNH
jgi:hypothetical protein